LKKISVVIVGYNNRRDLEHCLKSLAEQEHWNWEAYYVDNHSTDGSAEFVAARYPQVEIVALHQNIGFAGANNIGIRLAKGDYVMTLNPDVWLEPSYMGTLAAALDADNRLGGVQGKLLRAAFDGDAVVRSDTIDSTGDIIHRDRHAVSRGQGETDRGQYDAMPWTFSLTAAAALWNRAMLDAVAFDQEYFDEDFFIYKEDIDLCWRGRRQGWEFAYIPAARAYHARGWGDPAPATGTAARLSRIGRARAGVSATVRYHSFKNRHLLLLKNDDVVNLIGHLFWIIPFELGIVLYALFKERRTLSAFREIRKLWPRLRQKRRFLGARTVVSRREMRGWFGRIG
jgi:GT2 family glycosyltransferase